ncbi:MAG: OpgC domain-containing protein, partial [Comamonadaceae bacterium]
QMARPWWGDALLLVAVFGWLYAVARATLWWDRRNAPPAAAEPVVSEPAAAPSAAPR